MHTFALELFGAVRGHVPVYKLVIAGACPLDEFWTEIEHQGNLAPQLRKAITIIERHALGLHLPSTLFKRISVKKDPVNMYEVKTRDLRIYLFRNSAGAIIVSGGKKSTQKRDIEHFRNLTHRYVQQTTP